MRAGTWATALQRTPRGAALPVEPIPQSSNRQEVSRMLGIDLQLLAQLGHEVVHSPSGTLVIKPPCSHDQLVPTEDSIRVTNPILEEAQLLGGELDRLAGTHHRFGDQVHFIFAEGDNFSSPLLPPKYS